MLVIRGSIVDFIIDRYSNGYAKFIFKSDADKDIPRFEAICEGNIPDVVPGVPITAEFPVEDVKDIMKIDAKKNVNKVSYVCVNYSDENYAKTLLIKVKGISNKTAERILDAVDGDIGRLSEMWEDSEFWKGLRGSKKYLEELKESVGMLMGKEILFKKYSKYGIGYPQIDMMSAMYGLEAEDKLCSSPYTVMSKLDLNFQVADKLAQDLGFDYLCEQRVKAMINTVLKDNETSGNTAMKQEQFYYACAMLHKQSAWKNNVVSPYYILSTISTMNHIYYESGMFGFLKTLNKETDIAVQLDRLMGTNTELYTPPKMFDELSTRYNKEQLEFLKTFDSNSVTVLLGRGGTGKTHTICGAIELFKQRFPDKEVRLCAPTARAAGVLKEQSGHESSTIHILLGINPYENEEDREIPQLDVGMIVVDEMSMVDTSLMYSLLQAIKSGTKLILSGDPDQLESVGCGSVLADLIDSGTVPKVRLKKIMRQSEGSAIVDNCGRILNGRHDFVENESFRIRVCNSNDEALQYLKSCYSGDIHTTQILSTTKKNILGTTILNKTFEDTSLSGVWLHGSHFKVGDKVVFTRNNYDKEYCNGDIGFIETITMPVKVKKQGEDKSIEIDKDSSLDMEHADVITIHKSQGSEYQKVYILLPDEPKSLLTRNMVNTAISRARQDVTLIIVNDALKDAASNCYKRKRTTRLKEKLKNIEEIKG